MRYVRLLPVAAFALALACDTTTTTAPDSPSFKASLPGSGASTFDFADVSVDGSGNLVLSFKVHGVGNNDVTFTLAGSATTVYGCINGGGNHPKASNKESNTTAFSTQVTLDPTNGGIESTVTFPVPTSTLVCPSGQTFTLISVRYFGLSFTNSTAGEVATLSTTDTGTISFFP
jgi:hypothetical protein